MIFEEASCVSRGVRVCDSLLRAELRGEEGIIAGSCSGTTS